MISSTPLNPLLYNRLLHNYGDVEIVHAGQANNWRISWETCPGKLERSPRRKMHSAGEEYRVRCARCKDYRPRLYINHRWGVMDEETRSRNLWLANCYNENCYSDYESQKILYERIYAFGGRRPPHIEIRQGRPAEAEQLRPIPDPGPLIRLDRLATEYPNHEAIVYLSGRGFDPNFLGRYWGVCYCPQSHYRWATNRIIIPIFQEGMQVGWQSRHIGDNVRGVPFNEAGVPKYWTAPDTPRRLIAYNLERAMRHSTVVVVEGPADVWNVGPMAVGAMGKSLSVHVRKLLVNGMKRHGRKAVVVVALDPQPEKGLKKDELRPHPINVLVNNLRVPLSDFGGCVVPLWLPQEYDPGSIDVKWFRRLAAEEAGSIGVTVNFGKPQLV